MNRGKDSHRARPWRSLEERARDPATLKEACREFPAGASEWTDPVSRRNFLKGMGAALALAGAGGIAGCRRGQADERIVPYVRQPEELVPGRPLYFASAMPLFDGCGRGVLVESHEGRPTKVEGNPSHPDSLGATDAFMQASVLQLYDPDRLQSPRKLGIDSDWSTFDVELGRALDRVRLGAQVDSKIGIGQFGQNDLSEQWEKAGVKRYAGADLQAAGAPPKSLKGLAILTETITSPSLAAVLKQLVALGARWHQYQPVNQDNALAGAKQAFGRVVRPIYHFDKAARIVSLDDDFLFGQAGSLKYDRQFIDRRRWRKEKPLTPDSMSRLYVVESTRTITGASADHRLAVRPSRIPHVAAALAAALGVGGSQGGMSSGGWSESARRFIQAAAEDLKAHAGASLVLVGESQPPEVHALGHALNAALGNVGKTVTYISPPQANPVDQRQSLRQLVEDLNGGATRTLLILGGNPVYTAPVELDFAGALKRFSMKANADGSPANFSTHLSLYDDETSELCQWALPLSHYLESWGDVRAFDGTASIIQPLIYPLYQSRTALELLAGLLGPPPVDGHDLVREHWRNTIGGVADPARAASRPSSEFENQWQVILEAGIIAGTAFKPVAVKPAAAPPAANPPSSEPTTWPAPEEDLEIIFRPDPSIWDGAFANSAWLQELPKLVTRLTWDNAVAMSMATAEKLKLADVGSPYKANEKVIRLQYQGRTLDAPVLVVPGHADDCLTVYLGYGRWRGGHLATGYDVGGKRGYNAYRLRTSDRFWWDTGLGIRHTDARVMLAVTQRHQSMQTADTRDLTPRGTVSQVNADPKKIVHPRSIPLSLYEPSPYDYDKRPYEWAMSIDNTACIGCNACVIACQAENNVPTVGKEQVLHSREMHWIRIDTWFNEADAEHSTDPATYFEPIPCMQCELAPCEAVCPVLATTHSIEGINEMTYNRCIGTRYCSNNCPYKVRRFNFLQWNDQVTGSLMLQRNPDVTVRTRGVMEKCNYCIQRINEARIDAEKENRPIRDGEIQVACQQACPTRAIIFGNKNDPDAHVSKLREQPLNFYLLEELNTRPRTSYLPRISNPNEAVT